MRNFRVVDEIRIRSTFVLDPMTINRGGISSIPVWAFKNFGQSLKFGQTLFVVFMLVPGTVLSNQLRKSVNQYQSFAVTMQMPDFSAKMHQIQFRLQVRPRPH